MIERLLDVAKWGLIFMIAGVIFYAVYPKYYFGGPKGVIWYRANKITGQVERWRQKPGSIGHAWVKMEGIDPRKIIWDRGKKD